MKKIRTPKLSPTAKRLALIALALAIIFSLLGVGMANAAKQANERALEATEQARERFEHTKRLTDRILALEASQKAVEADKAAAKTACAEINRLAKLPAVARLVTVPAPCKG